MRLPTRHDLMCHVIENYFRNLGYDRTCFNAYIPKPKWAFQTFKLRVNARDLLNQIDMIVFKSDCDLCGRACGICSDDIVGIEVKPGIRSLRRDVKAQLEEYLCSCAITKLYLAVDTPNYYDILRDLRQYFKDMVGLIVVYDNVAKIVFNPKGLEAHICALYFVPPAKGYVVKYDFCNSCSKRTVLRNYQAYLITISNVGKQCQLACNEYHSQHGNKVHIKDCMEHCDCLIILARRSKSTIPPYICLPTCNVNEKCFCFEKRPQFSLLNS